MPGTASMGMIERTFGRLMRRRRLARDYETLPQLQTLRRRL